MKSGCVFPGEVFSRASGNGFFLKGDEAQVLAVAFEVGEIEGGLEGELEGGTGDDVLGSKDDERGS